MDLPIVRVFFCQVSQEFQNYLFFFEGMTFKTHSTANMTASYCFILVHIGHWFQPFWGLPEFESSPPKKDIAD
jgi:hypothetical protein